MGQGRKVRRHQAGVAEAENVRPGIASEPRHRKGEPRHRKSEPDYSNFMSMHFEMSEPRPDEMMMQPRAFSALLSLAQIA